MLVLWVLVLLAVLVIILVLIALILIQPRYWRRLLARAAPSTAGVSNPVPWLPALSTMRPVPGVLLAVGRADIALR
jgi:hypothetical protein